MVWVFFREGNPLYPVYFAASYSAKEWSSVYRTSSESPLMAFGANGSVVKSDLFSFEGGNCFGSINNTNLTDSAENKSVFLIQGGDGSNMQLTNGQHQIYTRHNRRDQVDRDRFETTMGFKEQWVEGDYSINVRGDYIIKVGKIDQESLDALQKMADYSSQINAQLAQSNSGGGGSSAKAKPADPKVLEDKPAASNSAAPLPDAFQKGINTQKALYWEASTPFAPAIIPGVSSFPQKNATTGSGQGPTNANVIASYTDPSSPYYNK
jgi:hypothetical protein